MRTTRGTRSGFGRCAMPYYVNRSVPGAMKVLLLVVACAAPVAAQTAPVVSPTTSSFTQPSNEIQATLSIHLDVFACGSIAAGACINQSATPVGAGVDVPAASVTTLATPDSFGNTRSVAINAAPVSAFLATLNPGVAYVATVQAIGDATLGNGTSPRSAASNPFFSALRPLTAPGNHKVK